MVKADRMTPTPIDLSISVYRLAGSEATWIETDPPISPDEIEQLQAQELLEPGPVKHPHSTDSQGNFMSLIVGEGKRMSKVSEEEKARAFAIAGCLAELRGISSALVEIKHPSRRQDNESFVLN